ncbi:class I SAM-dependent methyltransferase [Litoreibacter roseus]|uniref:ATP synthase subunit beta n=1 Tax=Litoreibacter roseus TaxID=2601869 RepID=A0A6N6JAU2_9RHOB|nr:SAM-dependent methyltransferase [Litoreibacter roseus]GFE63361.1 ATP synthase subunit beta [Litoreibacter roseus]
MTPLKQLILQQIALDGPLSVADYMALCLLHPEHGYYTTKTPFGRQGDFTTAPEISQMFGEVLGLCLAQTWVDQGKPAKTVLAEIGPGRGTLMKDVLRVICKVMQPPPIHLVEASPALRDKQRATLGDVDITWHDDVTTLPDAPTLLLANEFFDALPIRQYERTRTGWAERRIGSDSDTLVWGRAPVALPDMLAHRLVDTRDGDIVEVCPAAPQIITTLDQRIAQNGGAALLIDYGDWRSKGDTFQAVQNHQPVNPLDAPGMADLTAHVDFEALSNAITECQASQMVPQGVLLERLGITARAQALARGLSGELLESHTLAHRRLTHPEEMGTLFKALALYPAGAPLPPGFSAKV